jgi:hypothetical protein
MVQASGYSGAFGGYPAQQAGPNEASLQAVTFQNPNNVSTPYTSGTGWADSNPAGLATTTSASNTTTGPFSANGISPPATPPRQVMPQLSQSRMSNYLNTFSDPNMYWNEYSQGKGAQFTEQAGRAMAKAGRTGMLPTLNTLSHQDYMSNYLPSVRKDLQPTLTYENQRNQTLVDAYGKDLSYAGDIYKTQGQLYGADLDAYVRTLDINSQREIAQAKNLIDTYNIDTTSKNNLFSSVAQMWPEMSAEDRNYVMAILQGEGGIGAYTDKTLAEVTAPSAPTTTLPGNIPSGSMYPENYTG